MHPTHPIRCPEQGKESLLVVATKSGSLAMVNALIEWGINDEEVCYRERPCSDVSRQATNRIAMPLPRNRALP